MRVPRVQFRARRLMALVAGVAFLMPIGMWVRDMWWRRVYLLDGAAIVAVNERTARKLLPRPNVAPYLGTNDRHLNAHSFLPRSLRWTTITTLC